MKNKRWRNYGLWLSISAFIPMMLEALGVKILPDNYNELVKAFLGILVLAGLINSPKEGKWFKDEKKLK